MHVTLWAYPSAADNTVPAHEQSGELMFAHGRVSRNLPEAERAIGSYSGDMLGVQRRADRRMFCLGWGLFCCSARFTV